MSMMRKSATAKIRTSGPPGRTRAQRKKQQRTVHEAQKKAKVAEKEHDERQAQARPGRGKNQKKTDKKAKKRA